MPRKKNSQKLNATNARWWDSPRGKRFSVTTQLGIELTSNLWRQGNLLRTEHSYEDAKRIEAELTFVKFLAIKLEVPQWRLYDLLLSYGITHFIKEHWDKVLFMNDFTMQREIMNKKYVEDMDNGIDEYSKYLEKIGDVITEDIFVNYAEKRQKEAIRNSTLRKGL